MVLLSQTPNAEINVKETENAARRHHNGDRVGGGCYAQSGCTMKHGLRTFSGHESGKSVCTRIAGGTYQIRIRGSGMRERQGKDKVKNRNKHDFIKEKGRNLHCWGGGGAGRCSERKQEGFKPRLSEGTDSK